MTTISKIQKQKRVEFSTATKIFEIPNLNSYTAEERQASFTSSTEKKTSKIRAFGNTEYQTRFNAKRLARKTYQDFWKNIKLNNSDERFIPLNELPEVSKDAANSAYERAIHLKDELEKQELEEEEEEEISRMCMSLGELLSCP